MSSPAVTLRPEQPADADFLARLFAADAGALLRGAGLAEEAVEQLVAMQLRSRDASYKAAYPDARCGVAECGGVPVGRLVEADVPGLVHVVDVAVDPAWRGRGVATALLRQAMAGWAACGRGGRAQVFVGNAASLALFRGLGFVGDATPGDAQVTLSWRSP